jgi:transposase
VPNIPSKQNRRWKHCFSPVLYRGRNAIERMFGRLKDFRRIATRYNKLAANFLAAVQLAAAISCWLWVGPRTRWPSHAGGVRWAAYGKPLRKPR